MSIYRKRPSQQKRSLKKHISFQTIAAPTPKKAPYASLLLFFDTVSAIPTVLSKVRKNLVPISRSKKIGILFLFLGITFLSFPHVRNLFTHVSGEQVPIRADKTFTLQGNTDELPTRILIPSLSIDINVTPSKLINGYWEVSETSASFGMGSAPPGTIGNTVIFAHARERLFLPLKNIAIGKDIYVLTKQAWHRYTVEEIREVLPTDVYVVNKTQDNRLTLFTCSGFLDSKRLVVIAKPKE
ncbi:MAG: sortase [Patescibacteria group bacterium]|nr:sortase [Patescibacteria group bacterium]